MIYPETRRTDTVEEHFGIAVADPYRWLEGDARRHPEVADWVHAQDTLARSHLAELPGRDHFRQRLAALYDHARLTAPEKRGNRYFFTRNSGLEDQAVLLVREGADGPDRVLMDPNGWSDDGATALAEWAVSENGRYLAFATQEGGSDWRTLRVLDVENGTLLPDQIAWARFTHIAWARDGSGFFYSRFPEPPAESAFEAPVTDHSIHFHALGTAQADDRLVHATPKGWHDAGRLANKQNVFDDFIAAAEYLKSEGITSAEGLAIQGESNGGLLVGAVVNQRPDLFAAALPGVGVMDMLRFARFTNGQFWMGDYGDPGKEADFRNLLSYSPYHTIRAGASYPALLVTTADTDDRVVPAHSFKYVAALQATDLGDRPRLLRVDTRAGHGAGKPIGKALDELADLWAFAARWTGLEVAAEG